MTQSYEIRNLDCAACGVKIETAIRKLPGVSRAVVDFATLRLHLEATDLERVCAEIKTGQRLELGPLHLSAGPADLALYRRAGDALPAFFAVRP